MLSAPAVEQSSIVDKTSVNLVWSHPNDPGRILFHYNIIYYGYKENEVRQSVPITYSTVLKSFYLIMPQQLSLAKRADDVSILDGPYSVTVPATVTTYLIRNLQPGLTYSIIVSSPFLLL